MKKKLIICMVALGMVAQSYAQEVKFTIKGKVAELDAPTKLFLLRYVDGKINVDSVVAKKGEFQFQGVGVLGNRLTLVSGHGGTPLEQSTDRLNIYTQSGTIEISSSDSIANAEINGTSRYIAEDYYKKKYQEILSTELNASTAMSDAATETEKKTQDYQNMRDRMRKKREGRLDSLRNAFVMENPDELYSLTVAAGSSFKPDPDITLPLFHSLSKSVQDSEQGKSLLGKIEEVISIQIGKVAPDFTQQDTSGKSVSLSDFRGKYVLLDFWSSSCGNCLASAHELVKAYKKYKDKNFTIIGVSLDDETTRKAWLNAIAVHHMNWPQVSDLSGWKNPTADRYNVVALPTFYLIDPSGVIVAKSSQSTKLFEKLETFLK